MLADRVIVRVARRVSLHSIADHAIRPDRAQAENKGSISFLASGADRLGNIVARRLVLHFGSCVLTGAAITFRQEDEQPHRRRAQESRYRHAPSLFVRGAIGIDLRETGCASLPLIRAQVCRICVAVVNAALREDLRLSGR